MSISKNTIMKSWISLCFLIIFLLFISYTKFPSSKVSVQRIIKPERPAYSRLTLAHQQLLNSALAHIRLAYVANRTPHYSTPPLLILYTVHQEMNKSFDQLLLDITNTYFFSMLQPGSAFAFDMLWPIKIEWFFTSLPGYMSMNTDQAAYYVERTEPHQHVFESTPSQHDLLHKPFSDYYHSKDIKIVSINHWLSTSWMFMRDNPSMKYARDRYRLNHLTQKSDWFWIASRLLFSRPQSDWFSQQLEAYRDIMGGKLEYSESLSLWDPQSKKVTPEFASKQWLRIGVRVTSIQGLKCLVDHVVNVCQQSQMSCHVFISATNRLLLKSLRLELNHHQIAVHAVAEGFGFADLHDSPENNFDHSIFDSDEARRKRDYARTFMDWIILSRMDYLVGEHNDGFLKTAAWAAQVETDVYIGKCRIIPMSDW